MFTARAFWMTRRKAGFDDGSGPLDLTAMVMSFAIRANCFAMRFHRANIVCFLTSNMRPMGGMVTLFHQAEIGAGHSSGQKGRQTKKPAQVALRRLLRGACDPSGPHAGIANFR